MPFIDIDLEENVLVMNCTGAFKGKFVLGVTQNHEEFGENTFENDA